MPKIHLLVANTTAQSGKNAARVGRAEAELKAAGLSVEVLATLPEGATVAAVADRVSKGDVGCVISMGGDGTFREVGAALIRGGANAEVRMGMLPTGTANDQGRSFGLDAGEDALARNVSIIGAGYETRLDAGRAKAIDGNGTKIADEYFFDSAGWGISARILVQRNVDRQLVSRVPGLDLIYRDKLLYAGATLQTFLESYVIDDEFSATIVTDAECASADRRNADHHGKRHELTGLTDLIIKGTRVYGGAWVFDRTSRHDDGLFEMVPFKGKRDWTSKALVDLDGNPITEELLNQLGIEHSKPFSFSKAELMLAPPIGGAPIAAQVDGEEFIGAHRILVEVVPRALRLIVPEAPPDRDR